MQGIVWHLIMLALLLKELNLSLLAFCGLGQTFIAWIEKNSLFEFLTWLGCR